MRESIINESGEEIPIEKVYDLADRIRIFTDEQLDELWFKVGFVFSDREPGLKALQEFIWTAFMLVFGVQCQLLKIFC